jgi:hypothetical protein
MMSKHVAMKASGSNGLNGPVVLLRVKVEPNTDDADIRALLKLIWNLVTVVMLATSSNGLNGLVVLLHATVGLNTETAIILVAPLQFSPSPSKLPWKQKKLHVVKQEHSDHGPNGVAVLPRAAVVKH